jgi:protein-S-isoprenylcysteine O-methyltransferase Ste14
MLEWILFFVFSITLLWISRKSLRVPGSHGFYRFFAWECILGLFLLNVRSWFKDAFAWHQLISWALLVASLVPLVLGVRGLTRHGKPAEIREGAPQLLAFEKTSTLVTTGIYHYIRHPLYSSLLLLAWGIFFKNISWPVGLLALVATAFLFLTAKADEVESLRFFGPAYEEYMQQTRRFIPFIF